MFGGHLNLNGVWVCMKSDRQSCPSAVQVKRCLYIAKVSSYDVISPVRFGGKKFIGREFL